MKEASAAGTCLGCCKCGTAADLPELITPQAQFSRPGKRAHSGVVSLNYLRSACNLGSSAHSWCEESLFNKDMSDVIYPPGMAKGVWCSKRSSSAPPQDCCSEIHLLFQHPPIYIMQEQYPSSTLRGRFPSSSVPTCHLTNFPLYYHAS